MRPFSSSTRIAAIVTVLALGVNAGIASASAKTHATHKNKTRRVYKAHKRHVYKAHRHHVKKTTTKTKTVARAATAQHTRLGTQPAGIKGNWNLVLDSEFNTSSLNTNIWTPGWFGSGVTDSPGDAGICNSASNVTFPGDGTMHLNVTATPSTCQGGQTYPYTGALISSDPEDGRASGGFQYTYGVLEARVYVPGNGTQISDWPAVWTDGQSWPNDGEDDLMEGLDGEACYHFHDPLGGPGGCDASITPGWHTFASDWQPGSVTYYYDGTKVGSITTGITTAPMYIILSNGDSIGAAGMTADSMQVQYVRVWQH
jgi:beta-glucanase (GH16 family)